MGSSTIRRQNASCDPCRRHKKRCAFDTGTLPGVGSVCQNCKHFGHKCTYEFATARAAEKQIKKASRAMTAPTPPYTEDKQDSQDSPASTSPTVAAVHSAVMWAASPSAVDPDLGFDDASWPSLGLDSVFDLNAFSTGPYDCMDLPNGLFSTQSMGSFLDIPDPPASAVATTDASTLQTESDSQRAESAIPTFWHGSPVRLLNSRVLTEQLNKNLCHVYDAMMQGLANRHLSYRCNQFAGNHSYIIESENDADQTIEVHPNREQLSDKSPPEGRRITLIGVARFLDNFALLYGNHLDKQKRQLDEATLTAVLHAFALQSITGDDKIERPGSGGLDNSPTPRERDSSREIFQAAWFNAYTLLVKSKGHRSFVHLHAVLLFHMTAHPDGVLSNRDFTEDPVSLLDGALQQLQDLLSLVESFCSLLDPKSRYRMLFESSVRIVRWFGYVRDTIASFISDRGCVLQDLHMPKTGRTPTACSKINANTVDLLTPDITQDANRTIFFLFRQSIQLRNLIWGGHPPFDPAPVSAVIDTLKQTIEGFEASHDEWMNQCIANFLLLSTPSKQCAAFFILFWNMGILRVVQLMREANTAMGSGEFSHLLTIANIYEKKALLRCGTIATCINNASNAGDFNLTDFVQNRLPLISHHANTSPVVFALTKAVEHALGNNTASRSSATQHAESSNLFSSPEARMTWIKPLLICLATLGGTVSGHYLARPALQSLIRKHSDILLDCWTPDALET